ncbi:SGNH hydrolase-type esterase domain-containing protein [Penicillium argentinense]|uniref:SGNH hydrolase-type esterase domain-containing protein n=1 Tax=Penicillium argentinense TaxID=1131581 RepID=A0A9W9KAS7_9EURO|nr:SGNH hydrolase-type esterase domain-containing protein [Penicillium argentinense]KAJ5099283.1 SGNH hydrolase-type esterase domain-containing protein [Penicillium argentinense]
MPSETPILKGFINPTLMLEVDWYMSQGYIEKYHPSGGALRLMPLGGSVTRGVGSSHGTGYRKLLLQMLEQQGVNARMVGSRKDGPIPNNEHEGWRGFRIDEIEKKARRSVEGLSPDLFMVNAGSNDCLQDFEVEGAGERMSQMVDFLWWACPQSSVLLSTLIVSADKQVDSVVRAINTQFRALAEKKATEQKKIILVDMYSSEGPDVRDLVDGIHPDDEGYDKMAKLWFHGIQEVIHKGFIDTSKYKF